MIFISSSIQVSRINNSAQDMRIKCRQASKYRILSFLEIFYYETVGKILMWLCPKSLIDCVSIWSNKFLYTRVMSVELLCWEWCLCLDYWQEHFSPGQRLGYLRQLMLHHSEDPVSSENSPMLLHRVRQRHLEKSHCGGYLPVGSCEG